MIKYKDFEQKIVDDDPMENKKWKHILPAVPLAHRMRFLKTYEHGFDIPTCYDMILASQTIQEKQYDEFLQQMVEKHKKKEGKTKTTRYKSTM